MPTDQQPGPSFKFLSRPPALHPFVFALQDGFETKIGYLSRRLNFLMIESDL